MLDITEVARQSGLPASTLRYYEERKLICSIGRRGMRRTFDPAVLGRLALISLAREFGFSLADIGAMFGSDASPSFDRQMLSMQAEKLDSAIKKMSVLRDELRRAAACCAPSYAECPNFRQRVEDAAAKSRSWGSARRLGKLR